MLGCEVGGGRFSVQPLQTLCPLGAVCCSLWGAGRRQVGVLGGALLGAPLHTQEAGPDMPHPASPLLVGGASVPGGTETARLLARQPATPITAAEVERSPPARPPVEAWPGSHLLQALRARSEASLEPREAWLPWDSCRAPIPPLPLPVWPDSGPKVGPLPIFGGGQFFVTLATHFTPKRRSGWA